MRTTIYKYENFVIDKRWSLSFTCICTYIYIYIFALYNSSIDSKRFYDND